MVTRKHQQDPQGQPQRRKRAQAEGSRLKPCPSILLRACPTAAQLSQSRSPGTALSSPQMHSVRAIQGPFQLVLVLLNYLFAPLIQDLHKFCRKPTYKGWTKEVSLTNSGDEKPVGAENKSEFMESSPREGSKQPEKSQEFRQLQEEANYGIPPTSSGDDVHPATILCIPPCFSPPFQPAPLSPLSPFSSPTQQCSSFWEMIWKDRGWETAVEERQTTTREQQGTEAGHGTLPPQVRRATAACLCAR